MILASILLLSSAGLLPIPERLAARTFPSICADGSSADRLCAFDGKETPLTESPLATLARHDLIIFPIEKMGLTWSGKFPGDSKAFVAASVAQAQAWRKELASLNPNAIVLAEMPYADAPFGFLPLGSSLWRRKPDGHVLLTIGDASTRGQLKFESRTFRKLFEARIRALMATGVVDGIELKNWDVDSPQRLSVAQAARRGVGKNGLIALETGPNEPTLSATYVNALVMNGFGMVWSEWRDAAEVATWTETHTRKPNFTVLEGVAYSDRTRQYEMRAVTTLALEIGNGFVCFSDSTGHDWYDFWSRTLGRPVAPNFEKKGVLWREYDNGTVIFNPTTNNSVTVDFNELHTSEAKSISLHRLSVQPGDGDIALSKPPTQ